MRKFIRTVRDILVEASELQREAERRINNSKL